MVLELAVRFIKIMALFGILWALLWANGAYGCRRVEGQEMAPAIPQGQNLTIDPRVTRPADLEAGDVVVFTHEVGGKAVRSIASRVVGLPGDRVRIQKGEVFVNGEKRADGQVSPKNRGSDEFSELVVPRDSVFVLGDNRVASRLVDSRSLGPISRFALSGRVR
jgi:signal peptidase I